MLLKVGHVEGGGGGGTYLCTSFMNSASAMLSTVSLDSSRFTLIFFVEQEG